MDRQDHARNFVIQTGIETHQKYFSDPKITYLSIEDGRAELCGNFIFMKKISNKRMQSDQNARYALILAPDARH